MSDQVRVMITGGAGFIGRHLVAELVEKGHRVCVLDSLVEQVHGPKQAALARIWNEMAALGVERFFCEDVRNGHLLVHAIEDFRPQVIVHLAAEVGVGQAEAEIVRYVDANVVGTASLLEAILKANDTLDEGKGRDGVRRLVVAGSMSSYGEGAWVCSVHGPQRPHRLGGDLSEGRWAPACIFHGSPEGCSSEDPLESVPIQEFLSLRPAGVYAATKRDQEELSLLVARSSGLSVAVCRFFNVYGPGQALGNPYTGVAATFAARCLTGLPPRVYEDGHQTRDLIHVRDVARGVSLLVGDQNVRLAMREWADPSRQGVFNVATGFATEIGYIAEVACSVLAPELVPEISGAFRMGDIRSCIGDSTRLRGLGWEPQIHPETGLRELFASWKGTPAGDPVTLERAHAELLARRLVVERELKTPSATGEQAPEAPEEGSPSVWAPIP